MGCNCKANNITELAFSTNGDGVRKVWYAYVLEYTVKTLAFIVSLVVGLPILNFYVIYLLFKFLILNRNLDMNELVSSVSSLSKKIKMINDIEDEDDYEHEEDELILSDVDEIEELTIFEKK